MKLTILGTSIVSFLLGMAVMHVADLRGISMFSQMTIESLLDTNVTLLEHMELGNLDVVRETLISSVECNRDLLESELNSPFWEETGHTRQVIRRSQPYAGKCPMNFE